MIQLSKRNRTALVLLIVLMLSAMQVLAVLADTTKDSYGNKLKTYISYSYSYGGKAKLTATGAKVGNLKISDSGAGLSLSLPVYKVCEMKMVINYKCNGASRTVTKIWNSNGYDRSSKSLSYTLPPGTTSCSISGYAKFHRASGLYSLLSIIFLPHYRTMTIWDSG